MDEDGGKSKRGSPHAATAGGAGGAYFLGFLGAVVYYIQTATGFWDGAFGVFKALFWPAFLIYEILRFVGA